MSELSIFANRKLEGYITVNRVPIFQLVQISTTLSADKKLYENLGARFCTAAITASI
jgi:hypothetical protein